ncbi:MAG: hypothetical protein EHM23_08770 [Acidobacteria bacterium]|nr:MAG: hypothetical protein EHM23_08770 [Acidobacteriota bacterium]
MEPLAYLITFTTYGTHLHGDPSGSVSKFRNSRDHDYVPDCPDLIRLSKRAMRDAPFLMNAVVRKVVFGAILATCRRKGWIVLALHVRVTHVHGVICFQEKPRRVVDALNAAASQELNKSALETGRAKRWTRGRSAIPLWTIERVRAANDYVLNQQGEQMETFEDAEALADLEGR